MSLNAYNRADTQLKRNPRPPRGTSQGRVLPEHHLVELLTVQYAYQVHYVPLVILCDVLMPGMDGFELRDRIDADPVLRMKAIPFVYFSTWGSNALVNKAYQGTIQGYHLKGRSFAELQAELSLIVAYWKRCLHPRSFQ